MPIEKLAHAELRVPDIGQAVEYNINVFGLREIDRIGETVYLGCGFDNNYDLALTPGGTGIPHFAFQVNNEDDLKMYKKRVENYGLKVEERSDAEPGEKKAICFDLPATNVPIRMELVTVADRPAYFNPASSPNRTLLGAGAHDLDHLGLKVANSNKVAEFLETALDFKMSDIFMPAPGIYGAVWSRVKDYHHELAFMSGVGGPTESLDHIAFYFENIDHMKRALDMLAMHDLKLEFGIGRHALGANLYAYFWACGNRYELSAEMPRVVDDHAETVFWNDITKSMSSWGVQMPASFKNGS
ncbi:VOC family protein [Neobacillus vireti]|uniref:VOC family protein n=1 Tax=Neobacillus vireti TaxID=220686 RepID=UPI002FFFDEF6